MDLNSTFLQIELRTWLTAAAIAVLLAVAHFALRGWARRRARRHQDEPLAPGESASVRFWIARGLGDAIPPLAFLLWLHGLSIAATMLLGEVPDARWSSWGLTILAALRGLGTLLGLAWLLARIARTLEALLQSFASRTEAQWDDVMLPFAGRSLRAILPMLALILGTPALSVTKDAQDVIQNAVSLALIGTIGFILVQFVDAIAEMILKRHRLDVADNREARGVYTQVMVLKKIAVGVIAVFAIASMLMVFQSVRQFGTAMIASAGVAGIVIGFAAQKSLATLLAGFQIAMTQPIRIDDVVIVEGEWGRIEEITLTYVVVRIWDLRRLVVPITYFIEKPFQNWTRISADILGSVFIQVDYGVPVDALRQELTRILESSPNWDRKVNVLQVTDAKERTLELRALASSSDASKSWDLRCEVREKLIAFLQKNYPLSLPRLRATLDPVPPAGSAAAG
ncbi:MAG TPA: mechanosensitive ion channel domain-containing protein [Steroidobacteraceae bacterium]|nr:mechanosensitive ion channel domain-containing protein [Steroidobacteraceae bacterium]